MIFIDTGAFIARYHANDQFHESAKKTWSELQEKKLVTTSFVISETLTLLARRIDYSMSAETGRRIYMSKYLNVVQVSREEELEAIDLMEKFADQKVTFTDCTSFVMIKKLKIKEVFGYDKCFLNVGVKLI